MITVRLTEAEAQALLCAAGNVMDYPDAAAAIFPHPQARKAAYRASEKLRAAIGSKG